MRGEDARRHAAKQLVNYRGQLLTLKQLARETGIAYGTLYKRYVAGADVFARRPIPGRPRSTVRRAVLDPDLPYELDDLCQRMVAEHPEGMEYRDIGRAMGFSHQRAEQLVKRAIRKLAAAAQELA